MTELKNTLEKLHRKFGGITTTLRSIEDLTADQRRFVLNELLTDGVTLPTSTPATEEANESTQESTGLPQKLRGAVHALTRNYPPNLVVDAAMLEMPEEQRAAVARCFLPVEPEPKHEVRRHELLDAETAEVLWSGAHAFTPQRFDYVRSDGSVQGYQREGFMAFEFGPGAEGITGRSYYRTLKSLAEESEQQEMTLREKLGLIRAEKEAEKAGLYTVVDVASGEELGLVENIDHRIRVLDGKTGQPISYEHVRIEPEYDFREGEARAPRKLALYRKVTAE